MELIKVAVLLLCVSLVAACVVGGGPDPDPELDSSAPMPMEYNADSWRTIIPAACTRFFDGCNQCTRAAGAEMAACTRKACMSYQKPACLDEPSVE